MKKSICIAVTILLILFSQTGVKLHADSFAYESKQKAEPKALNTEIATSMVGWGLLITLSIILISVLSHQSFTEQEYGTNY